MFQSLPEDVKILLFRDYFSYDEKVKLLDHNLFDEFLLRRCCWRNLPKVPLKTLKCAASTYLNVLSSGLYKFKHTKELLKVTCDNEKARISFERYNPSNFTKRKCFSKVYDLHSFKRLVHGVKEHFEKLNGDVFFSNHGSYACFETNFINKLDQNFIYSADEKGMFVLKKNNSILLISVMDNDSVDWNEIHRRLYHWNRKIYYKDFGLWQVWKMYPWTYLYKWNLKMHCKYLSRKNIVKAQFYVKE